MNVCNTSNEVVEVAGVRIAPGRTAQIDDRRMTKWLGSKQSLYAKGSIRLDAPPPPELTRDQLIAGAIAQMDPDDERLWDEDGKPQMSIVRVNATLGDVTFEEKDDHWERRLAAIEALKKSHRPDPDDKGGRSSTDDPEPPEGGGRKD